MDLQQAEDLFGSIFHVFRCCFGAHSFLEGDNASKNREERIDSSSIAGRSIAGDAAGETDNRFSELFGKLRDTDRSFSHDRLTVESAFTGDDKIGIFHIIAEPGFVENDLNARFQRGGKTNY